MAEAPKPNDNVNELISEMDLLSLAKERADSAPIDYEVLSPLP